MTVNWDEVQKELFPIKNYEDLCRRWREAFAYPFVRGQFNFTMTGLADYTRLLLGGDARGRYTAYAARLTHIFDRLHQEDVQDLLDLSARLDSPQLFESFSSQSRVAPVDTAAVLKYLVYWVIPMKKMLGSLVSPGSPVLEAVKILRGLGIRANLDILGRGMTPEGREALCVESGLPGAVILELVNRADFSRMPWASKATISNIIGAGYGSLAKLASPDLGQLYEDFFRYGESIGKNLKFGNEIESSYRISKIVPVLVQE